MTYPPQLNDDDMTRARTRACDARAREADLWDLAGLGTGARVADVGCGTGAITVALAEVVGPDGSVVGIDADPSAVRVASAALVAAGIGNAEVRTGRAEDTGLAEGSFDTVVLRHVLAHTPGNEQRIIGHLARLVRPGGHLYLVDVDPAAPCADAGGDSPAGRAGGRLAELARSAGLAVVASRGWSETDEGSGLAPVSTRDGVSGDRELERWVAAFDDIDAWTRCPELPLEVCGAVCRRPAEPSASDAAGHGAPAASPRCPSSSPR